MTVSDGKRLWRHFQRFAEYEDLRDLYRRCIPEILKFEQKLIDFEQNQSKLNLIMRSFDEFITLKADKISINELYKYCDESFTIKDIQIK